MDLDETSCDCQSCLGSKYFTRFIALSRGLRLLTTLTRIKCFLPINHERMDIDGSWWNFVRWSVLGSKCFTRFIAFSRGLRPLTTLARIKCFLPINHERINRSWWYLHILLILMRRWSWHKVKVTRSKVKVIYVSMWKYSLGYSSWTNEWILMKLCELVSYA